MVLSLGGGLLVAGLVGQSSGLAREPRNSHDSKTSCLMKKKEVTLSFVAAP